MKVLPLLLAVAACQSASEPTAGTCNVTVRFGSYAMGIDAGAAASIDKLLAADPDVTGAGRSAWGREGEYTLCISTRDPAAANRLVGRIATLLPAQPRGPISVESANRRVDAPVR